MKSYEDLEELAKLFSRMLKFSTENTEKNKMEAEEMEVRIIVFQEAAARLALGLVRDVDNPAFILGCFILSGVGGNIPDHLS